MPLGIKQNNSFLRLTIDVWQNKVFYNEQEYPAGYFASSILNISVDEIMELISAGGVILQQFPTIANANKRKLGAMLPSLKEQVLTLAELLWKYPPFCFNDKEQERHLITGIRLLPYCFYPLMPILLPFLSRFSLRPRSGTRGQAGSNRCGSDDLSFHFAFSSADIERVPNLFAIQRDWALFFVLIQFI